MGLAVTSRWAFDSELASGTVRAVLTDWELPDSDLWVVFPAGRLANAKTRAFVKFIKSVLDAQFQPGIEDMQSNRGWRASRQLLNVCRGF